MNMRPKKAKLDKEEEAKTGVDKEEAGVEPKAKVDISSLRLTLNISLNMVIDQDRCLWLGVLAPLSHLTTGDLVELSHLVGDNIITRRMLDIVGERE